MDMLNLNDNQKDQINQLRHEHRLSIIDINAEIKKLALMKKKYMSDADYQNAKKVTEELSAKRAEISKKRIEMAENIYKLLDKEQKAQFLKVMPSADCNSSSLSKRRTPRCKK